MINLLNVLAEDPGQIATVFMIGFAEGILIAGIGCVFSAVVRGLKRITMAG